MECSLGLSYRECTRKSVRRHCPRRPPRSTSASEGDGPRAIPNAVAFKPGRNFFAAWFLSSEPAAGDTRGCKRRTMGALVERRGLYRQSICPNASRLAKFATHGIWLHGRRYVSATTRPCICTVWYSSSTVSRTRRSQYGAGLFDVPSDAGSFDAPEPDAHDDVNFEPHQPTSAGTKH